MTPGGAHRLRDASSALLDDHDALLLDLDGVVYVGPDAVPGAADALAVAHDRGVPICYLTNNASRTASVVAGHLRDLGMPVASDEAVVTSAQAIARLMAERLPQGAAVLLVGGDGLREALTLHGLIPVGSLDDDPVAVVQGYAPTVGWRDLAEASYAIAAGLPWFASNTDLTVPTARGVAPGNGALVQAVRTATGAEPIVAGKPERPLFDETMRRLAASRPLMVGDRLDTDIDGAIGAGIASLAVLTGISSLDDLFAAEPGRRPDFVAAGLAALLEPHPTVQVADGAARCGSAAATVRGSVIEIAGAQGAETVALRAATQLAWSVRDTSGTTCTAGATLTS